MYYEYPESSEAYSFNKQASSIDQLSMCARNSDMLPYFPTVHVWSKYTGCPGNRANERNDPDGHQADMDSYGVQSVVFTVKWNFFNILVTLL